LKIKGRVNFHIVIKAKENVAIARPAANADVQITVQISFGVGGTAGSNFCFTHNSPNI
jgi:hypothetical protein